MMLAYGSSEHKRGMTVYFISVKPFDHHPRNAAPCTFFTVHAHVGVTAHSAHPHTLSTNWQVTVNGEHSLPVLSGGAVKSPLAPSQSHTYVKLRKMASCDWPGSSV